jgi:hypothetical protein
MSAFANAPPKGSRPKPKPLEHEQGTLIPDLYSHSAAPVKPPSPPPVARVSEKRQKELDAINQMMEEDDEPQGPHTHYTTSNVRTRRLPT